MPIRSHFPHFLDPRLHVDPMSTPTEFKKMRNLIPVFVLMVLFSTGCDSGDVVEQEVAKVQVRLELENLAPLLDGYTYQAWAKIGFITLPSERFNVVENGSFVNSSGQFIQNAFIFTEDISDASQVFITIEDKRDSDETPSGTVVLAGDVSGSSATLSMTHPLALNTSFGGQSGSFMLMSWVSGAPVDDTSGLWFIEGTRNAPTAGLSLPTLPDGWTYEGWVDKGGALVSTGTFRDNSGHDLERLYSTSDTPPFPGEDFVENPPAGVTFPLDPSGGTVQITVEPFPDDTVLPYGITVLSGAVPASPTAVTPYPLTEAVSGPTGVATIF